VIVLDTNVLSELMRPKPASTVVSWIEGQRSRSLYVTSVTLAEILFGVLSLPAGRRRASLEAASVAMFESEFVGRVLPFGEEAAPFYARIAAARRRAGRPIAHLDAQIAAIACMAGATVATRNIADFERCGVDLVDPWSTL
jgi:predicted nucleic acid-binding protein